MYVGIHTHTQINKNTHCTSGHALWTPLEGTRAGHDQAGSDAYLSKNLMSSVLKDDSKEEFEEKSVYKIM